MRHYEVREVMTTDPVTVIAVDGELGYAVDDTITLPGPERDESPLTRGIHPPLASRRLT